MTSSPANPLFFCCARLYWEKNSMVLSLVRWMPACNPRIRPKRYSSPICAPLSRPKKSSSRSPKSPSPSGRRKRCVTRNALENCGSRRLVGSAISVKSGCDAFGSLSGSSAGGGVFAPVFWAKESCGHEASKRAHVSSALLQRIDRLLVVRCTDLDPPFDHSDLPCCEIRGAVERHSASDVVGASLEFLYQITVVRVTCYDSRRTRFQQARGADKCRVGGGGREVEAARRISSHIRVALDTCRPSARIGVVEDLVLDAAEGRLEVGRWARQI